MSRSFSVVLAVVLLTAFASGQAEKKSPGRMDLFGGFSWLSQDLSLVNPSGTGPIGWNASITFPQPHGLGVVADFSGYYPSFDFGCGAGCSDSAKVHSFLAGHQISMSRGRVRPFARFLIGDTYMSTSFRSFTASNSFTFGAGGGVDFNLSPRFALRGQVDWLHNGFKTSDNQRTFEEVHNLARLSTGIVVHF